MIASWSRSTPTLLAFTAAVMALFALLLAAAQPAAATARPDNLAVLVNDADPLSVEIGGYYAAARQIPRENLIHVRLDPASAELDAGEFQAMHARILQLTPPNVQFYAVTWVRPYRVDCMSITSALAFGFNRAYCASRCVRTRLSPYFGSDSATPWSDLRIRPAMSIAARTLEDAIALIDRGVAADGAAPSGSAYLVTTGDAARDVRGATYDDAARLVGDRIRVMRMKTSGIKDRADVMFYFTGSVSVPALDSNRFLPGAIADHLTSLGGILDGTAQMSSLRWLEAGATGSYGTVAEPCNIPGKFPNPGFAMQRYLAGETLIESYWKSVAMPGQGLFIGEPLARPYLRNAVQ